MTSFDSGTIESVIRLLGRITSAATEAVDLPEALAAAIDEIARFAGWPIGHAYLPAKDGSDELVSSGIWHVDDEERYRAFRELSEATNFPPGVGLPGRVLASREPCWINDLNTDENFPRAHQGIEIGLRAGFAVPVLVEGEVAAVMEFYAPQPVEEDSYLLTLMEEVGNRLGLIFDRRQALDIVRQQALITDQVGEAVIVADFEGRILDSNAAASRSYGFEKEELRQMKVEDLMADLQDWGSQREQVLRQIQETGRWDGIVKMRHKDSGERTFELSLTGFKDGRGQHTATLGVGRDVTEREEVTRVVKQQAVAMEQLSEAVFVTDLSGKIIECNRATEVMYGRPRKELIGMDGAEMAADPNDWRERRSEIYPHIEKEGKWSGSVPFQRTDGTTGMSEFTLAALRNEQGERIAQVCIARDVSEQDRVIAELLQQAQIIEQLSEAVLVVDAEGGIVDCNPALERMTGYDQSELIGMFTRDLTPDPEAWSEKIGAIYEVLAESGYWSGLVRIKRKDGEERTCELSISKLDDTPNPRADHITLARDVTERINTEKAMRQQALIMEQLTEAVFVTSLEGRVIDCNRATEELMGYTREELIGMEGAELHGTPDEWRETRHVMWEQLDRSESWFSEAPFQRKDGSTGIGELSVSPLLDDDGKRTANVCFVRDITERKELEGQLLQAQKMEAVGQLTGGVAHDFNNLLTAILGNLEMVEDRITEDPKAIRMIGTAIDATLKGANLTQQLLAFSRKQPLQPRRIVLNELLPRMRELMGRTLGEDTEIKIVLPGEDMAVRADPAQLESAILNLAINARDAMPGGGRMSIAALVADTDQLPVALAQGKTDQRFIAIEISDGGTGMAPSVLEHVFEPFFTTKEVGEGSGLGLSMVYGFAKQSGGHAEIESKPGRGTKVLIFLPEAGLDIEQDQPRPRERPPGHHTGTETILVVEDDADVREYASNVLESLGYAVISAGDGKQAMALMQGEDRIDLLFTDVVLPGGMDGARLADIFRAARPEGKVLFTSGYTRQVIEKDGRLAADQRLLPKPYGRKDLVEAFKATIKG